MRLSAKHSLGLGLLVAIGAGALAYVFNAIVQSPGPSAGKHAPILSEISPQSGAVVFGPEVWLRWVVPPGTSGRVYWRQAGSRRFQRSNATGDDSILVARVGPVQPNRLYEYVVEQDTGATISQSEMRTFEVRAGLSFEPQFLDVTVDRDYDQTVLLTLRNNQTVPITVVTQALTNYADLPLDVVGSGSLDAPFELQPRQELNMRLAVTATDATSTNYEIPVEANGAYGLVRLRVRRPEPKLSFEVLDQNPITLAKRIRITNVGPSLGDLALHILPPAGREILLSPTVNHANLPSGSTLDVVASPILYLEFNRLDAHLEARAGGRSLQFPLEFVAPAGTHLIGARTGTQQRASSSDWYCTNKPVTCSDLPAPPTNGPLLTVSADSVPIRGSCDPTASCSAPQGWNLPAMSATTGSGGQVSAPAGQATGGVWRRPVRGLIGDVGADHWFVADHPTNPRSGRSAGFHPGGTSPEVPEPGDKPELILPLGPDDLTCVMSLMKTCTDYGIAFLTYNVPVPIGNNCQDCVLLALRGCNVPGPYPMPQIPPIPYVTPR